jgi:hypothetical protein
MAAKPRSSGNSGSESVKRTAEESGTAAQSREQQLRVRSEEAEPEEAPFTTEDNAFKAKELDLEMAVVPPDSCELELVVLDTIVALVEDKSAGAKTGWANNLAWATKLAEAGKVEGYDKTLMKMLPVGIPDKWGPDAGPHYSVVSAPPDGTPTEDDGGNVDDLEEVKRTAGKLRGTRYIFPLDDATLKFILCNKANDELTNGPVMLTQCFGLKARAMMNKVRLDLGLGPFGAGHAIHQTLCKITYQTGHADMRASALVQGWPRLASNPKLCEPKFTLVTVEEEDTEDTLMASAPDGLEICSVADPRHYFKFA